MRRLSLIFLSLISAFPLFVSAYSISCSSVPGGAGCGQCFHFDLAGLIDHRISLSLVVASLLLSKKWSLRVLLRVRHFSEQVYLQLVLLPISLISPILVVVRAHGSGQNEISSAVTKGNIPSNTNYSKSCLRHKIPHQVFYPWKQYHCAWTGSESLECGFSMLQHHKSSHVEMVSEREVSSVMMEISIIMIVVLPLVVILSVVTVSEKEMSNVMMVIAIIMTLVRIQLLHSVEMVHENDEQCDDGNSNNNDSCMNNCRFPQVTPPPGQHVVTVREGNEQCDDGNGNNNDTCTNSCTVNIINPRCNVQVLDSYGSAPLHFDSLFWSTTVTYGYCRWKNNTVMGHLNRQTLRIHLAK